MALQALGADVVQRDGLIFERIREVASSMWRRFTTSGSPTLQPPAALASTRARRRRRPPAAELDWPGIVAHACRGDNDHVVKLVHACRNEARAHAPDAPWRAAAARAVA